jgi:hypothetical protein
MDIAHGLFIFLVIAVIVLTVIVVENLVKRVLKKSSDTDKGVIEKIRAYYAQRAEKDTPQAAQQSIATPKSANKSSKGDQDDKGGDSAQNDRKASCAAEKEIAEALAYFIRYTFPSASVATRYYEETSDEPGWDVIIDHNGKSYIIFVNKEIGLRVFVQVSEEDYHEVKGRAGSESEVSLKLQQMITDLQQPAQVPEPVTEQKDGGGM